MIEFLTVNGEFSNVTIIERSKFICYLKGVDNEEQAKEFISKIKKLNSLANHNCYAYIADDKGLCMKFSDDGEPQGTAGLPMLEVLKNKGLYKTVAVVTRYFGGIKLGTGGLTRAYSGAVSSCLALSKIAKMKYSQSIKITCNYDEYSKLLRIITNDNIKIISTDFGDTVCLDLVVIDNYYPILMQEFSDFFKGKEIIEEKGKSFYPF